MSCWSEALWGIGQDVSTVGLSEGPQVGRERDHGDTVLVAGVLETWSVGWMGRRWGLGGWLPDGEACVRIDFGYCMGP